jgi:hypothetical protein
MREKQAVTWETRGEYQKAGKKQKALILDQFTRLNGINLQVCHKALGQISDHISDGGGGERGYPQG